MACTASMVQSIEGVSNVCQSMKTLPGVPPTDRFCFVLFILFIATTTPPPPTTTTTTTTAMTTTITEAAQQNQRDGTKQLERFDECAGHAGNRALDGRTDDGAICRPRGRQAGRQAGRPAGRPQKNVIALILFRVQMCIYPRLIHSPIIYNFLIKVRSRLFPAALEWLLRIIIDVFYVCMSACLPDNLTPSSSI